MRNLHTESMTQIGETSKQLEVIQDVLTRLGQIENGIQNNQRIQKSANESLIDKCERSFQKINEVNRDILRIEEEMGPRDARIKHNTELVINFKEKITTEVTAFMK